MTDSLSQPCRIALVYSLCAVLLIVGATVYPLSAAFAPRSGSLFNAVGQPRADGGQAGVQQVKSADEWGSAVSFGQTVLFVNCEWHIDVVAYRRVFREFGASSQENMECRAVSVTVDPDGQDELWPILQSLWAQLRIDHGMKLLGGAGRIVWFDNGQVVDYALWFEVPDVESLRQRTKMAFQ